jgi:hypothetical protein
VADDYLHRVAVPFSPIDLKRVDQIFMRDPGSDLGVKGRTSVECGHKQKSNR